LGNVGAKGSQEFGVMATKNARNVCRKSIDYLEVALSIGHGIGTVTKMQSCDTDQLVIEHGLMN
jgi:hypothetical protein